MESNCLSLRTTRATDTHEGAGTGTGTGTERFPGTDGLVLLQPALCLQPAAPFCIMAANMCRLAPSFARDSIIHRLRPHHKPISGCKDPLSPCPPMAPVSAVLVRPTRLTTRRSTLQWQSSCSVRLGLAHPDSPVFRTPIFGSCTRALHLHLQTRFGLLARDANFSVFIAPVDPSSEGDWWFAWSGCLIVTACNCLLMPKQVAVNT